MEFHSLVDGPYLQKYLGPSVMTANFMGGLLNSLGMTDFFDKQDAQKY